MFLFVLLTLLIVIITFGILYRPPQKDQIYINPSITPENPSCQRQQVSCTTDADCAKCVDNLEIKCIEMNRSSSQEKKYGKSGKYCLPVKPRQICNEKNGGIWTWTGWSGAETMEWDCLCTFPSYAGGKGCDEINPDFCKGGTIQDYDARVNTGPPIYTNCTCPKDTHLLVANEGTVPLCVPSKDFLCKDKTMCESMYSNSVYIE